MEIIFKDADERNIPDEYDLEKLSYRGIVKYLLCCIKKKKEHIEAMIDEFAPEHSTKFHKWFIEFHADGIFYITGDERKNIINNHRQCEKIQEEFEEICYQKYEFEESDKRRFFLNFLGDFIAAIYYLSIDSQNSKEDAIRNAYEAISNLANIFNNEYYDDKCRNYYKKIQKETLGQSNTHGRKLVIKPSEV